MKLKVELWKSDQNQEEIHLYLPDERNTYVMGFNPKQVSIESVQAFLGFWGYQFDVVENLVDMNVKYGI